MKLRYRSDLTSGIVSIIAGIVLLFIIPQQIGDDYAVTYGITSKTVPYAVAILWLVCGVILAFRGLVLKKDTVKEIAMSKELKVLAYMAVLVAYVFTFRHNFLITTGALGVATLAFLKTKKGSHYVITIVSAVVLHLLFTQVLHINLP